MLRTAFVSCVAVALLFAASLQAAEKSGLTEGKPDLKSIGPIAFGPDGVLFIGDPLGAAIFAVQYPPRLPDEFALESGPYSQLFDDPCINNPIDSQVWGRCC
jgi:hypothetical protein